MGWAARGRRRAGVWYDPGLDRADHCRTCPATSPAVLAVEHPPKNAKWRSPLEHLQDGLGPLPRPLRSESRCVVPEHPSRPVGPSVSTQAGRPRLGTLLRGQSWPVPRGEGVDGDHWWCVQQRLVCSAGDSPAGVIVRSPVAWIAGRRETEFLKPIDKVSLGEICESSGHNASERASGLDSLFRRAEPATSGRRQHGRLKAD